MEIKCLGTGSKGNCYLLKIDKEVLILDCGINFDKIITDSFIGGISNIKGCLITHEHKDHSLSEKKIKLSGIKVISYNNIENKLYKLGNFEILPFNVYHDVVCYGFLIRDRLSKEVLCYATDTYKLPLIKNVDYWLVECNYCDEILNSKLSYEYANYSYIERLRRTHMGDEQLFDYFSSIHPKYALLVHQSNSGNYDNNLSLSKLSKVCDFVRNIEVGKTYKLGEVNYDYSSR